MRKTALWPIVSEKEAPAGPFALLNDLKYILSK